MAYLVQSLVNLRAEIDRGWPNRDRRTDGWYADPKVRISYGHNPDGKGAVHAIDVDKDGINPDWIIDHIFRGSGALWYIIWNRGIWDTQRGWRREAYNGSNPHTDHMHIEVFRSAVGENYAGGWNVALTGTQSMGPAPPSGAEWGDADPILPMALTSANLSEAGTHGVHYAIGIADLRNL